ncbi:hypothetical protein [Marinovum sp.]|uniref:hypothetical protein n=1 Tax=Marinovum sp. TaxID=2024839 RepID=UPI003A8F4BE3
MSILTHFTNSMAVPTGTETPTPKTLQDVQDEAMELGLADVARAIGRLAEFFAAPLSSFEADLDWFDRNFALAKRTGQVPGQERSFWKTVNAYNKWRNKVRRRIEHSIGAVAEKQERKARADGWAPLIDLMGVLSCDGGPIHAAEVGVAVALADWARRFDVDGPLQLDREAIDRLLDHAPSEKRRKSLLGGLGVLKRYQPIRSIATHLPDNLDVETVRRRFENVLPRHVEAWVDAAIETGRLFGTTYDPTTRQHAGGWRPATVTTNRSALRSYIWSASLERGGPVDLESLSDFSELFTEATAWRVVAGWNDGSELPDGVLARTAYKYVSRVMTILDRNGMDAGPLATVRRNSTFLIEGKQAEDVMSPKTIRFCRPLVEDLKARRQFLTQHIAYRERAEDLLATDKVLPETQLTQLRMFGVSAAFAAIELCGAAHRVTNVLQLHHRGMSPNLLLPNGKANYYQIVLDAKKMKVARHKPVPQPKIRRNALEGAQTLDWYLKSIRPLFPYGNPAWCSGVDQPFPNLRFRELETPSKRLESCYLFVAPRSADHLSKSVLYTYLCDASDAIGMPLTPHNFRHGLASILLKRSLANVGKVATLLNNTPGVVLRNYGWINEEAVIEEVQDEIVEEALS